MRETQRQRLLRRDLAQQAAGIEYVLPVEQQPRRAWAQRERLGRIGQRGCRRWCLTGETMSAAEAYRIGLADIVVADDALDEALATLVDGLLMNAPGGLAESKASIGANARPPLDRPRHERALASFATGRASAQAAEGTAAFLAKRPPRWRHR